MAMLVKSQAASLASPVGKTTFTCMLGRPQLKNGRDRSEGWALYGLIYGFNTFMRFFFGIYMYLYIYVYYIYIYVLHIYIYMYYIYMCILYICIIYICILYIYVYNIYICILYICI
jgi:hypothetical protein